MASIITKFQIIDALKSVRYPSDKGNRLRIGIRNNIPGETFSPAYNTHRIKNIYYS